MTKRLLIFSLILMFLQQALFAQQADTTFRSKDTVAYTIPVKKIQQVNPLQEWMNKNVLINSKGEPTLQWQVARNAVSKDGLFYILVGLLFLLGILKAAFSRYFSNLVRVFFNTSLRQGQLTDQLLQAKLPSMFFNLFFGMIAGWYLFLLLGYYGKIAENNWNILLLCVACVFVVYMAKYVVIKFTGWVTGYKQEAETYIFIVFMINKIISFFLVPIVIILPFSKASLVNVTVLISYIVIALLFGMRFFRSYGMLQSRLKLSSFHFALYFLGIEVLPLFIDL